MSLAAAYYVFLIGILLPVVCVRSYFKLKAGARFPPKPGFFKSTLITLGIIFAIALLVWRSFHLPLFPAYEIRLKDVAIGFATVIVFVCAMYPRWKYKSFTHSRDEVFPSRATSVGIKLGWWIAVGVAAGIAEEFAYRGVLFGILIYWIPNWWAASSLCALAFALGHCDSRLEKCADNFHHVGNFSGAGVIHRNTLCCDGSTRAL